MRKAVTIYTDGAASPNPGKGGWAALLQCKGHEKELSGSEFHTTSQRMELTAALEALRALREPCEVVVYSDSTYLIHTMQGLYKTKKNLDLWRQLFEFAEVHDLWWEKVESHTGLNLRAHRLAQKAIKEKI